MTSIKIKEKVITERIAWINNMTERIKELPLANYSEFTADKRNMASAESYLRRALEALFDLGRHLLAKGFGKSATEYKEIAVLLHEYKIINEKGKSVLTRMAGYRNRMVHYYNEITDTELYDICSNKLSDFNYLVSEITHWIKNNPDRFDKSL